LRNHQRGDSDVTALDCMCIVAWDPSGRHEAAAWRLEAWRLEARRLEAWRLEAWRLEAWRLEAWRLEAWREVLTARWCVGDREACVVVVLEGIVFLDGGC
jgi:hypothetical protein